MSRRAKGEGSVRLRQDGRWEATLTLPPKNGKRQRRSYFGRTRQEAAKKLRVALGKQDSSLPLPGERETVGTFLDAWLRDSAAPALRPRTAESYKLVVESHLKPALGKIKLARLSPADVQQYMNAKRAAGLSARTVQYHHAVLRRALREAEQWGKVARNVCRLVTPPKVERPEVRPLTPEQARKLLGALAESRDAALYAIALGLGLRQGETLGLQWADIDFEAGTLMVNHTLQRYEHAYHLDSPKTAKSRHTLGLPASLVQLLQAHRTQQLAERLRAGPAWQGEHWNLVFCTEAGLPLPGNWLTHRFQTLLESLSLPRQRFHDLRHASASFMLASGADLRVVMEVLGHSQITVTANTYAHIRVETTRLAAEAVDALLAR